MSNKWTKLRTLVLSGSFFQHGHSPYNYTAKASYNYPGLKQGLVLNIDRRNTLSGRFIDTRGSWLFLLSLLFTHVLSAALLTHEPITIFQKILCALSTVLTTTLYCFFIVVSNKQLLQRILLRSGIAYVKLYMCFIESVALISLLDWKWRAFCTAPLFFSQLLIFTSDAVLFHLQKKHTVLLILLFLFFRLYIVISVQFEYFDVKEHEVNVFNVRFMNSGTFISKSVSLSLFLCAQLIFHFRHPHSLFSVRTSYTVLQNHEWASLERQRRLERKRTLSSDVKASEAVLKTVSTQQVLIV